MIPVLQMMTLRSRVVNKLLKFTQLVSGRVRIQTQVCLIVKLLSATALLPMLPSRPLSEFPQAQPLQHGPCLPSSSNKELALYFWRHSHLWELWVPHIHMY